MNFEEYQKFAAQYWKPGCDNITFALGLGGETGEVLEIIKKARRDCKEVDLKHLAEELGDVLWYLANMCTAYGFSLKEIAERNKAKLSLRYNKATAYRRNGPHIEEFDLGTGKHIRFVSRSEFSQIELKTLDDLYEELLRSKDQKEPAVEAAAGVTGGENEQDECPFD